MRARRSRRAILAAGLAATAIAVPALAGGSASASPTAGASVSHCDGHAALVRQIGPKLRAKATLKCTGDVATMRVRTCLQMQNDAGTGFLTAKCMTMVRHRPGFLSAIALRACPASTDHVFRTRATLFLKDKSGEKDRGTVISAERSFPRFC